MSPSGSGETTSVPLSRGESQASPSQASGDGVHVQRKPLSTSQGEWPRRKPTQLTPGCWTSQKQKINDYCLSHPVWSFVMTARANYCAIQSSQMRKAPILLQRSEATQKPKKTLITDKEAVRWWLFHQR